MLCVFKEGIYHSDFHVLITKNSEGFVRSGANAVFAANKVTHLRTVCLVLLVEFGKPTLYMVSIERPVNKFLNIFLLQSSRDYTRISYHQPGKISFYISIQV